MHQENLFPWGNPNPSLGECCGCKRAPVPRFRFNLVIEDAFNRYPLTQLLCTPCISKLVRTLAGQSVEPTPQSDLNRLDVDATHLAWPVEVEA